MPRHLRPLRDIIITVPEPAGVGPDDVTVARAHLATPVRKWRRNPWAWGAALLLHALVIAAALLVRVRTPPEPQSPPGVSVVFDSEGTGPQTTAPQSPLHGPPQPAEAPKPPPPPPAAPAQPTPNPDATEVQVPDMPLTALPNPPPIPAPPPRPAHAAHPHRAAPPQKYVFLNGMSYGNPSPAAPAAPPAPRGLKLNMPTSDAQAATASDFSVKGNAGADWDAALTKWVQEHAYYPQAAIEQNQEGTATVEFTVDRQGHVTGLRLLDSAGSPFLDQAWEQLFRDNTLPPFPPDAKDDHVTVRYTVHYQLIR